MGAAEASKLRKLAEDVRTLLDAPIEIATDKGANGNGRWTGPNADAVRGELTVRKRRLGSMAVEIEKESIKKRESEGGTTQ